MFLPNKHFIQVLIIAVISSFLFGCSGGGGTSSSLSSSSSVLALVIEPGPTCPGGGVLIKSGIDDNKNGVLDDPAEVDNEDIVCNGINGSNGLTSLINQSEEFAGTNCIYGGIRIDSGLDLNSNGTLDDTEISASSFVCNTAMDVPASGFATTDSWGETWDGMSRIAATYTEAAATCESMGGRLPTASELYRNNMTSGITSSTISSPSATEYLWTLIPSGVAGNRFVVRLSDGSAVGTAETSKQFYRCVWPDTTTTAFDKNACYGLKGSECWSDNGMVNIDSMDRLPLDYAGAAAECAFNNAGLPVLAEWQDMIHAGIPNGSNQWLWSANAVYWYNGNYGTSMVRWQDANSTQWYYDSGINGAVSVTASVHRFRCAGSSQPELLVTATSPACNGDCFSTTGSSSQLIADSIERVATSHAAAVESCRAIGAELPNQAEMAELIHAGLPNGSGNWLWLSDPMYWYSGNYGNAIVKFSGTGSPVWSYKGGLGTVTLASGNYNYYCVWRQKTNDLPVCTGTDSINRDQNNFSCVTSTDGDSAGNALPTGTQLVDAWGNAWDLQQRVASSLADAESGCAAIGGRLPTASEVYAVRANQLDTPAIGDTTATSWLWTSSPSYAAAYNTVVRVSDGLTGHLPETSATPYRCIWPSTRSNTLSGRACYTGCFQPDTTIIADSHDRPATFMSTAIEECKAAGGRLPDFRELQTLIHQGWDNGSNNWLWVAESMIWYTAAGHDFGYPVARWSGAGTVDWDYRTITTGGISVGNTVRNFRCVYSTKVR